MINNIKKNVKDCILDSKRCVVEVQCAGNLAGVEFVKAIQKAVKPGVIKSVRYTFGTRDVEIQVSSSSDAKELYTFIDGIINGNVSHNVATTIINGVLNTAGSVVSGIFGSKYQSQTDQAAAKANAEAQAAIAAAQAAAKAEEEKAAAQARSRTIAFIVLGVVALAVAGVLIFTKKK